MKKFFKKKGFTLLEMVIAISIIGVISSMVFQSISSARDKYYMSEAELTISRSLESARNRAMAGVHGLNYGVRIDDDIVKIFTGDLYSDGNVIITNILPSIINSDQIEKDIIFKKLSGEASDDLTIKITNDKTEEEAEISVTKEGVISLQ